MCVAHSEPRLRCRPTKTFVGKIDKYISPLILGFAGIKLSVNATSNSIFSQGYNAECGNIADPRFCDVCAATLNIPVHSTTPQRHQFFGFFDNFISLS